MFFTQKIFFLKGILSDINEQYTSFFACKHKHMMKSGAPPDKVRVLYLLLPMELHGDPDIKMTVSNPLIGIHNYTQFSVEKPKLG